MAHVRLERHHKDRLKQKAEKVVKKEVAEEHKDVAEGCLDEDTRPGHSAYQDRMSTESEVAVDLVAMDPEGGEEGVQRATSTESLDWPDDELQKVLALFDLTNGLRDLPEAAALATDGLGDALGEVARELGTVEKFAPKRGFGIIVPDNGGPRIFAHWTQISSADQWPQLAPGSKVEYTASVEEGKQVALSITAPGGDPITSSDEVRRGLRLLSPFSATGSVMFFHKVGFGFLLNDQEIKWDFDGGRLELPATSSIYVSRDELVLAEGSVCRLDKGQRVRFRIFMPNDKQVAAAEVTSVDGSPLKHMSEKSPELPRTVSAWGSNCKPRLSVQRSIRKSAAAVARGTDPVTLRLAQAIDAMRPSVHAELSSAGHKMPCRFYAAGRCTKGLACSFSHEVATPLSAEAASSSMPAASATSMAPARPAATSRRDIACRFYLEGRCAKGAECTFSHSFETQAQSVPRVPKFTPACVFFARGECSRGRACNFFHDTRTVTQID